ncbi:homologous-pairing protein 2 homolog isoform X1 [Capsicum annuum]|uniref:homologous-pairing protein 2 homolog isoform X1 n=1 Tax=Capsicum annuum TaxID=4072 RepID=UPI001FB082F6|nr:homologous-pairing protein 2 homolog isoform X1 [Capsicum annuum]
MVDEMEKKLIKLWKGVTLVSPEDRLAIEGLYSEALNQRRRRKRIRDVWDAITENSPKNPKEFKFSCVFQEELGVEYDEDVGVNFQSFADLI